MSYNGSYHYSPYFQPAAGQNEQGQNAYQNTTNNGGQFPSQVYSSGSTHNTPQQSSIQGPPTFYSQPAPPVERPSASYTNTRLNDGSNGSPYHDSRGGYGYAARSSVDTTALGNLAHASTLGQESRTPTGAARDNASLQQIIDYNRARSSQGSAGSIAYDSSNTGYVYSHERTGTRDAANMNRSQPNNSRTQTPVQYQETQYTTTAGYSHSTPAHATTQGASQSAIRTQYQHNSDQQRQKSQQRQYSQPARPASGGSHRSSAGAHGQNISHQASQSPTIPTYRTPAANAGTYANANPVSRPEQSRYVQGPQPGQRTSASPAPVQSNRNYYATPTGPQSSTTQDTSSSVRSQQTSEALTTVSPEEQGPKTVDPSHVFNHYEYQRRQAAVAAEAAKKAAEAEEVKKAAEAATALKRVSDHATLSPETQSREEQMAAEMRQMIEKMRDYKSKDPSLFSQIWEQVKKTQPAGSIPAVPLSVTGPAATHNSQSNGAGSDAGKKLSPSPQIAEMPDLGKFPAQRRRRGGSNVNPTRKRKSGGVSEMNGAASDGQRPSSPITETQAHVNGVLGQTDQNRLQDRQVVYVSGTGPGPSSSSNQRVSAPGPATQPRKSSPSQAAEEQQASSKGRTNWPEHKKWDLAVAAKNTLLSYTMNKTRAHNITPEQILGFLNENPSYEELCRMIESRGFILERSHFARSLLQAIPDKDPNARPPPPPPRQQEHGISAGQSSAKSARQEKNGVGFVSMDNQQPYRPPTAQMTPSQSLGEGTSQIEEKSAVPLTKQEMARKRNIADIVDLSQLSDDDMLPPPSFKIPRLDGSPQPPPASQRDVNQSYRQAHTMHHPLDAFNLPGMPPYMYRPPQYHTPPPFPPVPSTSNKSTPASLPRLPASSIPSSAPSATGLSSQQRDLVNREDIVRPLDNRNERKRKKYNPKTIVRDVLIASARHPTMMPLNYHLEGLRKVFKHVNDFSDLSTFRWDLVDPGEPIIPARRAPIPAPTTSAPVVYSLEEENDADDEEASQSTYPIPRATQTTINIDSNGSAQVVSSARPSHHTRHPPKLLGPQRKRVPSEAQMNPGINTFVAVNHPGMTLPSTSGEVTTQPGTAGTSSITETPPAPTIRRRGRPPGSGSTEVVAQPSTVSPNSITDTSPSSTIRRRGRPPGAKNKHPRNSSGTATMPTGARIDTTPARPSGLRHTVSSTDGIAIVVPSPSPSVSARRPGRPRKNAGSPKSSQQMSPIFRVYKCKWKGCPAELHNLETLKKHVLKHSAQYDDGSLPCLWKGCGQKLEVNEEESDDEETQQPLEFGTKEIWAKHMERRHIIDDAWRLGDGPNNRSDSDVSDYVSDSAKRQVTPIISGKGPPDPLPLGSGSKSAKVYHKAHGNTTEQDKAEAFIAASEERRRGFGPGIDRIGATFVTKRKQALLTDEVSLPTKARRRTGD
ncbi:MAG: hypothetical protein Q9174_001567 [Haloplaca sp. 1 TL-2023]